MSATPPKGQHKPSADGQANAQTGNNNNKAGWETSSSLLSEWLKDSRKTTHLLEEADWPKSESGRERVRAQAQVLGVIRHWSQLESLLQPYLQKAPKPRLRALLLLGSLELLQNSVTRDKTAQIIHFAVNETRRVCSTAESRLVNAVLRKVATDLAAPSRYELKPALKYSHPDWLINQWSTHYSESQVTALLEWNQQLPETYAFALLPLPDDAELPAWLEPSHWTGYYKIPGDRWTEARALLSAGHLVAQDPFARFPVDLLNPIPGETLLDLCASPGGKTKGITAHLLPTLQSSQGTTRLVALDQPGQRSKQMKESLSILTQAPFSPKLSLQTVAADLLEWSPPQSIPQKYDGILLDVPCSNTGVIRRRPDVKWRLTPNDIKELSAIQLKMLTQATSYLKPEGRIVYSTCSLEKEENEQVIEQFLAANPEFKLCDQKLSFPPEAGHDGGGAFLLRR